MSQSQPLDLSPLTRLASFSAELRGFESVLGVPSLKKAHFQAVRDGSLPRITAPIESLELVDVGGSELEFARPETVKRFSVTGARAFDCGTLRGLRAVEVLEFAECGEVLGLDTLLSLPTLKVVVFEDCRACTPRDSLLDLVVDRIAVVDRNPFDAGFRARAATSGSKWVYFRECPTRPHSRGRRMSAWGTEPWANDSAADWLTELIETSDIRNRWYAELGADPGEEPEIVRAAAWVFIQLGLVYVWPIEHLDDDVERTIAALSALRSGVYADDSTMVAALTAEITELEQRRR